jgi:hypothetical protein
VKASAVASSAAAERTGPVRIARVLPTARGGSPPER